jgi:hypothetical protein
MRVMCFWRKRFTEPEEPLLRAIKDSRSGIREAGRSENLPAGAVEAHGRWTLGRYEAEPEGVLHVCVMSSRARFGMAEYHFYMYIREQGGLVNVRIPFTGDPQATQSVGYVEARGDMIPPGWFQATGMIDIRDPGASKYSDGNRETLRITATVVEKAERPYMPPSIAKLLVGDDGTVQRVITKAAPRRRLLIRRPT